MTERIEPDKLPNDQARLPARRTWHAPEFQTLDVWSTETKTGVPSDGKPSQS